MKLLNIKRLLSHKGFTLIELLVVIAVLGVLSAAIVAAINPLNKINQAKDSNIKNDISTIAGALQAFYTGGGSSPTYPAGLTSLTPNELKAVPASTTWTYAVSPSGCNGSTTLCTGAAVSGPLNITAAGAVWCWKSDGNAPSAMAAASCTAP